MHYDTDDEIYLPCYLTRSLSYHLDYPHSLTLVLWFWVTFHAGPGWYILVTFFHKTWNTVLTFLAEPSFFKIQILSVSSMQTVAFIANQGIATTFFHACAFKPFPQIYMCIHIHMKRNNFQYGYGSIFNYLLYWYPRGWR